MTGVLCKQHFASKTKCQLLLSCEPFRPFRDSCMSQSNRSQVHLPILPTLYIIFQLLAVQLVFVLQTDISTDANVTLLLQECLSSCCTINRSGSGLVSLSSLVFQGELSETTPSHVVTGACLHNVRPTVNATVFCSTHKNVGVVAA